MSALTIYRPVKDSPLELMVRENSGIVGTRINTDVEQVDAPLVEPLVLIDYEGNLYGAFNLRTWAQRVRTACDRHTRRYPTVARSLVPAVWLERVGSIETTDGKITLDVDRAPAHAVGCGARAGGSCDQLPGCLQDGR